MDNKRIILYKTEEGKIKIDVNLEKETVWLNQKQMAELFEKDRSVVTRHINNIFKEGELNKIGNVQKMHFANSDKPVSLYSLDVVISVGYRVKSKRGTQFRIWANSILKEYLIKGYALNESRYEKEKLKKLIKINEKNKIGGITMKKILILFLIISNMIFAEYSSTAKDIQENSLTIYNGGFGLVREIRDISNISNNEKIINYLDVAQGIEPDSIIVSGANILALNYEYDLVSLNKLLEKYIGKDVIYTKGKLKINCILLSVKGGIVLKNKKTGEIYLGVIAEKITLPKMVKGLRLKPALVWDIEAGSCRNDLEVSYLTNGIKWEANYVINLNKENLNLVGWVNIDNNSGKDYKNTKLKLIAGDVNKVNNNEGLFLMKRNMVAASSRSDSFKEKSFFDYHMYTLNRNLNVKNNQSKQIKFISGENIRYKKYYLYSNRNKETNVIVSFENNKNNGLGIAFPKGKIKIYKKDLENNSSEFVGEDRINHTPKDEKIKVLAGKAFDVKVEYKEMDYKKISRNVYEKTIEYTIKNHRNERININIEYSLYGDWEMLNSNTKYNKDSAKKIIFPIVINKGATYILKFKYRIK